MDAVMSELRELFCEALERPSDAERQAYLDRACGEDKALRCQVEALLAAHQEAGDFLEGPASPPPTAPWHEPGSRRAPGDGDRPLPAGRVPRRGRHGRRLPRRADAPGPSRGGAEDHQARHGHRADRRPLRGRAPGAGPDGPPQHRPRLRRRRHRLGPALLRDGAGPGHPDHRVLRPRAALGPRAAGAVRAGLPGRAARAPEGDHPPRPQALQRAGDAPGRRAGAQGHRLRRGQGDRPGAHRSMPRSPARPRWSARRCT